MQPLFTGAIKYDDDDVVTLKFDDYDEPDLELCEALRSRCVVSEGIVLLFYFYDFVILALPFYLQYKLIFQYTVRRSALKALGELLQYPPSVEACTESGIYVELD